MSQANKLAAIRRWKSKTFRKKISRLLSIAAIEHWQRKRQNKRWFNKTRKSMGLVSKNRWKDKKYRSRVIKSVRKTCRSKSYRLRQSRFMKKLWNRPEYIQKRFGHQLTCGTDIELKLRSILRRMQISFIANPIMPKLPDIYINKSKLCLFADGEHWHKNRKVKDERDRRVLKQLGYSVLRLSGKTIKKRSNYCIGMIRRMIGGNNAQVVKA